MTRAKGQNKARNQVKGENRHSDDATWFKKKVKKARKARKAARKARQKRR